MQEQSKLGAGEPGGARIRRTDNNGQFKPDRTSQYIGIQIRTGRRLRGMSRTELAEQLDLDMEVLASFERGDREPSVTVLTRISDLLEKPMPWFSHRAASCLRSLPQAAPATSAVDDRPRILLVDDAPDVLIILGAFIESGGLQVIKAASGDEALRIVAGDPTLRAIVTDNVMPGLSGTDLLLQVAQLRPDLPGLVITGCATDANGLGELPKTINVLSKPFRREELINRIRAMMQDAKDKGTNEALAEAKTKALLF